MQLTVFAELALHHLKFEPPCPLLKNLSLTTLPSSFSPSIVRCPCILFISSTAAITKWFIPLTDFTDCTPTRLSSISRDANACSQVPCGPWTCLISPLGFSKMITQLMVVAKWRKEEIYGWFILIFGRNKHNTIRQLPLNLKKYKQMKKGRNERLNNFIGPFVTRHKRRTCTIGRLHHCTQDITAWNLNWREFCIIWSFFACSFLLHFRGRGQWKGLEASLGSGSPHPSQPCLLFDGDKTRQAPDWALPPSALGVLLWAAAFPYWPMVLLACHSGSKVHASYPILWGLLAHIQYLAEPWNHRSGYCKVISIYYPPALQGKKLFLIEITFSVMPGQRKFIIPVVQFSSESIFFLFCLVVKLNIFKCTILHRYMDKSKAMWLRLIYKNDYVYMHIYIYIYIKSF